METTLSRFEKTLSDMGLQDWLLKCKQEFENFSRDELADLLRDISIALRSTAVVANERRQALEQLRKIALDQDLLKEKTVQKQRIEELRRKIHNAPSDVVKTIKARLDAVELQAKEPQSSFISTQDRIAETARTTKKLEELRLELELRLKEKQMDADLLDRDEQRRARHRAAMFDRDFVATLLGGIILTIVTLSLILSLFIEVNKESLEILKNGFWVLLGFFFGQSIRGTTNQANRQETDDERK